MGKGKTPHGENKTLHDGKAKRRMGKYKTPHSGKPDAAWGEIERSVWQERAALCLAQAKLQTPL